MKKLLIVLLLCGFAVSASADKLDDFESYATGNVYQKASPPWFAITSTTGAAVIETQDGNKYGKAWYASNMRGMCRPLGGLSIPNSSSASTLFLRVRAEGTNDGSFGLSDSTASSSLSWGSFEAQLAFVGNELRVRSAGNVLYTGYKITPGTWYNIWAVIDNSTDTFDVYAAASGDATGLEPLVTDAVFRNSGAGPVANNLITFLFCNNSSALHIDDIHITSGVDLSNPRVFLAHNPTPASEATGVLTSSNLSWYTAKDTSNPANPNPNVTKHYVYMREGDPNLKYITPSEVTAGSPVNPTASCTPPVTLAMNETYYWRVDESVKNSLPSDSNTIRGDLWSFKTQLSIPDITKQPTEARVFETDPNVKLTCVFTSNSPAMVTWYKYVDGVNDDDLSTGGDIVITTTDVGNIYTTTLQINTPVAADQGNYYCKINNGTPEKSSDIGAIVVNRLLAQYDLDGTLAPASGSAADAPTGQGKSIDGLAEPNSLLAFDITLTPAVGIDGVAGHAVQIDPNQYVDFGTAGYPKAGSLIHGIGSGLDAGSILCWVKTSKTATVYANYNDGSNTGFALSLQTSADTADGRINVRGESNQNIGTVNGKPDRPGWDMFDDAWHLVAATWKAGGTMRLYIDGQQVNSAAAGTSADFLAWQRGVLLGTGRGDATHRHLLNALFSGAIDNLRIYNYERDADSIASEYYTATGIKPCYNAEFTGKAYNFDNTGASYCKVDLADFAKIAMGWLSCGLLPMEACN